MMGHTRPRLRVQQPARPLHQHRSSRHLGIGHINNHIDPVQRLRQSVAAAHITPAILHRLISLLLRCSTTRDDPHPVSRQPQVRHHQRTQPARPPDHRHVHVSPFLVISCPPPRPGSAPSCDIRSRSLCGLTGMPRALALLLEVRDKPLHDPLPPLSPPNPPSSGTRPTQILSSGRGSSTPGRPGCITSRSSAGQLPALGPVSPARRSTCAERGNARATRSTVPGGADCARILSLSSISTSSG